VNGHSSVSSANARHSPRSCNGGQTEQASVAGWVGQCSSAARSVRARPWPRGKRYHHNCTHLLKDVQLIADARQQRLGPRIQQLQLALQRIVARLQLQVGHAQWESRPVYSFAQDTGTPNARTTRVQQPSSLWLAAKLSRPFQHQCSSLTSVTSVLSWSRVANLTPAASVRISLSGSTAGGSNLRMLKARARERKSPRLTRARIQHQSIEPSNPAQHTPLRLRQPEPRHVFYRAPRSERGSLHSQKYQRFHPAGEGSQPVVVNDWECAPQPLWKSVPNC